MKKTYSFEDNETAGKCHFDSSRAVQRRLNGYKFGFLGGC